MEYRDLIIKLNGIDFKYYEEKRKRIDLLRNLLKDYIEKYYTCRLSPHEIIKIIDIDVEGFKCISISLMGDLSEINHKIISFNSILNILPYKESTESEFNMFLSRYLKENLINKIFSEIENKYFLELPLSSRKIFDSVLTNLKKIKEDLHDC